MASAFAAARKLVRPLLRMEALMPVYFFDTRDDDKFVSDDVGVELVDVRAASEVAARSLAELALDVLPRSTERRLAVDVRDEDDHPVLTTELTFRAVMLRLAA
jgi:hypothetical protein